MASILKEASTLLKKNRDTLLKQNLCFFLIFVILNFVIQKISLKINEPLLTSMQNMATADSIKDFLSTDFSQITQKHLPILLILTVLFSFLKYFYNCLIVYNIAKNDNQIIRNTHLPSIFAIFITFVLSKLMCGFGFLLFIIPGIIFSVLLLMVPCIIVTENKTGFDSFDRSFYFMKKDMVNIIKKLFLFWIIYFCIIFTASTCINFIQIISYKVINFLSLNMLLVIVDNIFIILNSCLDTILYMVLSIIIQSILYVHYLRHSELTQETEQYEERKYTLEDYYREKEEPDDEEDNF
jgi:hypothetical protein